MDKLLHTPVEAARVLGIGRSKLYELLGTGELPSVRIGSCRRIPAQTLQAFVAGLDEAQIEGSGKSRELAAVRGLRPVPR